MVRNTSVFVLLLGLITIMCVVTSGQWSLSKEQDNLKLSLLLVGLLLVAASTGILF